jgi:EmrB/QacA subfamily drug resistance transporter
MFLTGLVLFTVVSLVCAVSPNPAWLVTGRLLQGAAGGLLSPQVIGMIQQLFRGRERGRAFGLYGASIAISTAVGPLAGGLLIEAASPESGWRWVFLVNLPIGLLALVLGVVLLPRIPARRASRSPDLPGVLLLGGSIACVLLPMIEQAQRAATVRWWLLGPAAGLLCCFLGWEVLWRRTGHDPLVDLTLLRARSYSAGSALGLMYFAGYTGLFLVLTLYLQEGLRYSALEAGAATLPFALGSAVTSTAGGRLVYRFGRLMVVVGVVAVALGLAVTAMIVRFHSGRDVWLDILGPLLVTGLGSGLVIGPNQTLAMQGVPPASGGSAAAVLQTGQRIGNSLGTAVAATLFFNRLAATRGDYPGAVSLSLYGATALVGAALLIGVIDLVLSRRAGRRPVRTDSARRSTGPGTTASPIRMRRRKTR